MTYAITIHNLLQYISCTRRSSLSVRDTLFSLCNTQAVHDATKHENLCTHLVMVNQKELSQQCNINFY